MKAIKYFNSHNDYNLVKTSNDFFGHSKNIVSYCNFENTVYFDYFKVNKFDILYSDANGNLSFSSEVLPVSEGKTPIALCVIETNFFGAGEPARLMSLKYLDNTASGSLTATKLSQGNVKSLEDNIISNLYKNVNTFDYNDNTKTPYYLNASNHPGKNNAPGTPQIPNLFTNNNKWNLNELGTKNEYAITMVNGREINDRLNALYNNSVDGAILGAYRYTTLGTSSGDWYVPALGELAMIVGQITNINNKLSQISNIYPNDCISSLTAGAHMSCTSRGTLSTPTGDNNWRISTNSAKIIIYNDNYYALGMMLY